MRYCYARLLSVGNPSGPVKFSGQPQYDSEQVVSPLFTFSAPPMGGEEGEGEEGGGDAAEAQVAGTNQLAMAQPAPALKSPKTALFGAVYGAAPTAALYQSQQKGAGLSLSLSLSLSVSVSLSLSRSRMGASDVVCCVRE